MAYTPRELVIFAGSLVAIIASMYNIVVGATGTGLYISGFGILMFGIVIVWTLKKEPKTVE
jgi:type IV secretory pathway TrbD component